MTTKKKEYEKDMCSWEACGFDCNYMYPEYVFTEILNWKVQLNINLIDFPISILDGKHSLKNMFKAFGIWGMYPNWETEFGVILTMNKNILIISWNIYIYILEFSIKKNSISLQLKIFQIKYKTKNHFFF